MSKTKEVIKKYTDAATLDILGFLHVNEPHVFHFRRIEKIATRMIRLVGSVGTPYEAGATSDAMREMEGVADNLHDTLAGRAFDGDALLQAKYKELLAHHNQLKQRSLDIDEAHGLLRVAHSEMEQHKILLDEQTQHIERERERLQLTARTAGQKVDLPPMPSLTTGIREEAEDIVEDVADAVDSVKASVGGMLRNVANTIDPDSTRDEDEDVADGLEHIEDDEEGPPGQPGGQPPDDTGSVSQPPVHGRTTRENY